MKFEYAEALYDSALKNFKSFCDPDAQEVVRIAEGVARRDNFGKLNLGIFVVSLHRRGDLMWLDPAFEYLKDRDIFNIYNIGQIDGKTRKVKPVITHSGRELLDNTKRHAIDHRHVVSPNDILVQILESNCKQYSGVSRFDQLWYSAAVNKDGDPFKRYTW